MTDYSDTTRVTPNYVADVVKLYGDHFPSWRIGQAAFNALPDWLADEVRGTHRDPFHLTDTDQAERFIAWADKRIQQEASSVS